MPEEFRHLRLDRDARGVATVTFDVQGSPVNVFNAEVVADLGRAVAELERDPPKLVVFRSGKASGFFAGADVKEIRRVSTDADVQTVLRAGQDLFARVENLPCPTVAVIHGPCLGGGLEFALSCKHRVARDDGSTKIGLPEVQLGLIPGWGGTQRLPRLVGLRQALKIILDGSALSAAKAAKAGLVDLAAPPDSFDAEVNRFVDDRLAGKPLHRPGRGLADVLLDGTAPGRAVVFAAARKKIGSKARGYPAVPAALAAIRAGYGGSRDAGFAAEREGFTKVVFTPAARSLMDLFFQREKARKASTWVADPQAARPVKRVAVVGAGTMGAGIAQLLALNGIGVVLKDINDEIVAGGVKKIEALTAEAVAKGAMPRSQAEAVAKNVTPTSAWEPLADADLVIEAVVERMDVKRDVFAQLAARLRPTAVLASNTSALSVSTLGEATTGPGRVAGLHFFNPVHRMPLVEVVRGKQTDDATVATLVELVRKLGKVPVVVADSPGFLVNRILFPYMDEAVRLVSEGVPGDEVDREAVRFGMPMGPLELLDQVGIDVAADVAKTLIAPGVDVGPTPERLMTMAREGWTGKKAGRGFYEYHDGKRKGPTQWAAPTAPRKATADGGELSEVQRRLVYPMVNEAAKCLEAGVVSEAWVVDLAMVLGTGFAPFRGGPLRTADTLGLARVVRELDELRGTAGERFAACGLLRTLAAEGRTFHEADRPVTV